MGKIYFVYIILSKEGYKYTGMTEDLGLRLKQHNDKTLSLWNKRGNNWKLIYKEEFLTKAKALKREKWFKTGVGREFINEQIK